MPQLDAAASPGVTGTSPVPAPAPPAEPAAGQEAEAPATTQEEQPTSTQGAPEDASASPARADRNRLADHFGLPPELRKQVMGEEKPSEQGAGSEEQAEEPEPAPEPETEEGEEQEHEEEGGKPATAFNDPKVQKRMARFTKRIAEKDAENTALRSQLEQYQQALQQQQPAQAGGEAAAGAPGLEHVQNERDLNRVVGQARTLLAWAKANADGVLVGEGENQQFITPEIVARYHDDAQSVLLNAPEKRTQIRDFSAARQSWDSEAQKRFAPLFDKDSPVHAEALQYVQAAPWIAQMPEANLVMGAWLLGQKAMAAGWTFDAAGELVRANGGAPARPAPLNPDLDPALSPEARRLRAQIPMAPATPRAPSSQVPRNGQKQVAAAFNQALAAGGDRDSISAAIGALRAAEPNARRGARDPIPR